MFVIELNPTNLVYLTKLMDAPGVSVKSEDVMSHAQIRQQLANPTEAAKLVEQLKAQGAREAAQSAPQEPTQESAPVVPLKK